MTLGIVKRDEQELADWLAQEPGFLAGLARFDDEPIELEPYQLAFLRDRSRFRWIELDPVSWTRKMSHDYPTHEAEQAKQATCIH